MTGARVERRLAAIMATDIVGFSRMIDADEAATLSSFKALRADIVDPILAEYKGRIVKLMGDGSLVEFNSVVDAVACAVAMQKGVAVHQAGSAPDRRIVLRIGINLGDVVVEGDDLFGDGVNVAARLEQLSPPGGVVLSGTAYDQMKGKISLPLDNMGEQRVKNISDPVRTYSVRMDGASRARKLHARRRRQWLPMVAMAGVLLAVAAAGTWWLRPTDNAIDKAAIAVLPFDNIGGDESSGRLADGITEDLITDLAGFPDFYVIARNSTAVYAGKPIDVRQVGADLKVRYMLEGSVQRAADQIRVTAQLIDAKTGVHTWSDRWDRPAEDVFALQTEIVKQAASRLGGTGAIMEAEHRAAQRKRPGNLSAYEKYLLARERLMAPTKEGTDEAIGLFKQVLDEDPKLARAWADLAWAYDHTTWFGADYATAHPLALEASQRAVDMDPMDGAAHAVLANQILYDGDYGRGKAELDTALRLNPGSANILILAGSWASTFGDPERGGELADQAIRLDPNYPPVMAGSFYIAYFMAERYKEALRVIDKEPVESRTRFSWAIRAASYAALDEREKAEAAKKEALTHHPDLTAESFANEPGFNETERKKLAETMLAAGFAALRFLKNLPALQSLSVCLNA